MTAQELINELETLPDKSVRVMVEDGRSGNGCAPLVGVEESRCLASSTYKQRDPQYAVTGKVEMPDDAERVIVLFPNRLTP